MMSELVEGPGRAIAGSGPDRAKLEGLALQLGVAERVRFLGPVAQPELKRYYNAADAMVLASSREGWANVLLEAMACGTPVVAFRCGSTSEVIEDGQTGYLVKTLAEAVAATDRAPLLDREAIRARFDLRFSATAMARRYLDVYGDLLARRPFAEAPLADVVTALRPLDEERTFAAIA